MNDSKEKTVPFFPHFFFCLSSFLHNLLDRCVCLSFGMKKKKPEKIERKAFYIENIVVKIAMGKLFSTSTTNYSDNIYNDGLTLPTFRLQLIIRRV